MILDLICLAVIIIIIVDISGFVDSIKSGISFLITKGKIVKNDWDLPLFGCSLCMTWWSGLIYLIVSGNISLINICLVLLLSFLTSSIKNLLFTFKDVIDAFINKINNLL